MNSKLLKTQRVDFINSVSNYKMKYQNMIVELNKIDSMLDDNKDTLLYSFLHDQNQNIIDKINLLQDNLEGYITLTLNKVDKKISDLEYEESLISKEDE